MVAIFARPHAHIFPTLIKLFADGSRKEQRVYVWDMHNPNNTTNTTITGAGAGAHTAAGVSEGPANAGTGEVSNTHSPAPPHTPQCARQRAQWFPHHRRSGC